MLTTPEGVPPLLHRRRMIDEHGVYTFDMLVSAWSCPHDTGASLLDAPPPLVFPFCAYVTLEELIRVVAGAAAGAVEEAEPPRCAGGGPAALEHADYHAFHLGERRDLVVRWRPSRGGGGGVELLWWDPWRGHVPAGALSPAQAAGVARSALLRAAMAHKDGGDEERAVSVLAAAVERIPGEPELLRFLPWLSARARTSVAGAIAGEHVRCAPNDPAGYYWLAHCHVLLVSSGTWGPERLGEAAALVDRALALRPDYPDAEIARANVARLGGRDDEARAVLERLLARHPGHPEANYTLGLVLLPADPAGAAACFARGEASAPADADYPRSRARALAALGRVDEARAALARARALAPHDRRIEEIERRLPPGGRSA